MQAPYYHFFLYPVEQNAVSGYIPVYGYLACSVESPNIAVKVDGKSIPIGTDNRADLNKLYPDMNCIGVYGVISSVDFLQNIRENRSINLQVEIDGRIFHDSFITLSGPCFQSGLRSVEAKKRKREFILDNIICPQCRAPLNNEHFDRDLKCETCGAEFLRASNAVSTVIKNAYAIKPAINTSFCSTSQIEHDYINFAKNNGGFVLDFGCGFKSESHPNVVNLEIADFPSTDIVAFSDVIPFRDNVFDVVINTHVLEHVKNPWAITKEFHRIVKPGGFIVSTVPYLCPVHGFPYHFFNMTRYGMLSLFENMQIVSHTMNGDGHPLNAIKQILSTYFGSLPQEAQETFGRVTISDIVSMNLPDLLQQPYADALPEQARWELAAHSTIVARKV